MSKEYSVKFNREISRILSSIYNAPPNPFLPSIKEKRNTVYTEQKYIQFLVENEFIQILETRGNGEFSLTLKLKGYDVFEKYKDWDDYRKKVIDKKHKVEEAKSLAQRFWWLSIVISGIALVVSIIALIKK